MGHLLDFEKQEKGYKSFEVSRKNFLDNIGKQICYVDYVEPYRGTYFVRYGVIHGVKRNHLLLSDGDNEVEIRKIKDCGIKIDV